MSKIFKFEPVQIQKLEWWSFLNGSLHNHTSDKGESSYASITLPYLAFTTFRLFFIYYFSCTNIISPPPKKITK
jgi:hypothetical protein